MPGLQAAAFQSREKLRAGAKDADAFIVDQVDQAFRTRMERRTVVQHHRAAHRQGRDQPIPHHPAAGGVVEQPVADSQVGMQAMFLHMLQQHATGAVDDALGYAGGAAGVEDVERVSERHGDEIRLATDFVEVLPQADIGRCMEVVDTRLWPSVRNNDQLLQGRQPFEDFIDLGGLLDVLAGVAISAAGDQHFWFDLAKAVDDALGAEVR